MIFLKTSTNETLFQNNEEDDFIKINHDKKYSNPQETSVSKIENDNSQNLILYKCFDYCIFTYFFFSQIFFLILIIYFFIKALNACMKIFES